MDKPKRSSRRDKDQEAWEAYRAGLSDWRAETRQRMTNLTAEEWFLLQHCDLSLDDL